MSYFIITAIGIFSVSWLSKLPSLYIVILLILLLLILFNRKQWHLGLFIFGMLYGIAYGYLKLEAVLPSELDQQTVSVSGQVIGLPRQSLQGSHFLLLPDGNGSVAGKMSVFWPQHKGVMPGESLSLTVKLKRPRGLVSPGAFDYQAYLFSQGITATAVVISRSSKQETVSTSGEPACLIVHIDCLRFNLRVMLNEAFAGSNVNGLAQALVIGDKSLITEDQNRLLRETGTLHLLAISGLHVGLVATFGFYIGRLLSRLHQLFRPLSLTTHLAPLVSISFAMSYSLLAGFSLPTQRALIMVLVFHLASLLKREFPAFFSLSFALVCVALWDPLAVIHTGFWLSFLAVAVLLWGFSGRSNTQGFIVASAKSQWLIVVGLFVPGLLLLGGVSLNAPIANMLAIPFVSLLVVPLLLLGVVSYIASPFLSELLLVGAGVLLEWLMLVLAEIDMLLPGFSYRAIGEPEPWVLAIAVLGVIIILGPLTRYWRVLGGLCILPLLFPVHQRYPFAIHFLDVGQGTAIVIEAGERVGVYDTGPPMGPHSDAGDRVVGPFLRLRGFSGIDQLWLSHRDSDHAGGVDSLTKQFPTMQTAVGDKLGTEQAGGAYHCYQGQQWLWGEVSIDTLWPPSAKDQLKPHYLFNHSLKSNDYSCTLLIEAYGKRFLLTGDIEKRAEIALLVSGYLASDIDVLLAPHHGSQTSSSSDFLDYTKPKVAVVAAGFNNRYGHPHRSVLNRYRQANIEIVSTAELGTISWYIDDDNRWHRNYSRDSQRRYWHDNR